MTQINDLKVLINIKTNNQLAEIERPVSLEYEIETVRQLRKRIWVQVF